MKICIAGVGAIGTYLAARLAVRNSDVSIVARQNSAKSIESDGVALTETSGQVTRAKPRVFVSGQCPTETQDWLFICAKAYSVPQIVSDVKPLIGNHTRVLFVQNGIPWWYTAGPKTTNDLTSRDRVIGCVTYANVRALGAGIAQHVGDDRFMLGQPSGTPPSSITPLVQVMKAAKIDSIASDHIEKEVWVKLWGNLAFNPISALTGATMDRIIAEAHTRPLVIAMMSEAEQIAQHLGIKFDITIQQRLKVAEQAGAFKTSMLQDIEAGRQLEIEAIIGSVSSFARAVNVSAPAIDTVLGLLSQRAATLQMQGDFATAQPRKSQS